jgi:hypothetical protein
MTESPQFKSGDVVRVVLTPEQEAARSRFLVKVSYEGEWTVVKPGRTTSRCTQGSRRFTFRNESLAVSS